MNNVCASCNELYDVLDSQDRLVGVVDPTSQDLWQFSHDYCGDCLPVFLKTLGIHVTDDGFSVVSTW